MFEVPSLIPSTAKKKQKEIKPLGVVRIISVPLAGCWWLTLIILTTGEVETRRTAGWASIGKKFVRPHLNQ
jgi:hypothetical protein